ncbi:MAG: hypothetical protein Cons2KO_12580 [Congregibacter sp.]
MPILRPESSPSRRQMSRLWLFSLLITALAVSLRSYAETHSDAVAQAEGFWEYTDLITRDGESLPLTGVFLIQNGIFMQQSIFNGESFATSGSMAHAGPYWAGGAGLMLRSNQTLSMDPGGDAPLTSAGALEHDLKVIREGDELTLIFGGGTSTVQTFTKISDADNTEIFPFADGGLALVDGHFILVIGNEAQAVTGYGGYERNGNTLQLMATRWAASDGEKVLNLRDAALTVTFDGSTLTLPSGQRFSVIQ